MLNVDPLISTSSITLETPELLVNSTSVRLLRSGKTDYSNYLLPSKGWAFGGLHED